ncbi:MAG: hypothetical protein GY765_21030 [bacterium]|nr:hypothetical protein [bacterium]
MRKLIFPLIVLMLLSFCSVKTYKSQFQFANKLAEKDLWKEAHLRWQKLLDKGENTAAIHNNIAIALETMGKTEDAEKEYRIALKMAPNNSYIQSNLDRLLEKSRGEDKDDEDKKGKKDKKGRHKRPGKKR